jgi:hypothetical protein
VQGQALVFNAGAEIGVGLLLLMGLVTPARSIMLTFIYWRNFLPTRYNTPDSASYHRQVRQLVLLILIIFTTTELATSKPKAIGHTCRASAATSIGPAISVHRLCLTLYFS